MTNPFQIGKYRPIYLWAGPGTIRMNKVKFMNYPVDENIHLEAHRALAAKLVVDELYTNWVHLMYDWGFPPEVEVEDWEDFRKAADAYHAAGSPVFAYIQTSNCVFSGSFRSKDWYARDPKGRKVYYYSRRYMVDWTHPEWLQHLKGLIKGAIERGADGIFFDNMWYGEEPFGLLGAWLGGAGCYCDRCQALYQQETGHTIPEKILPEREEVAEYLRWRAGRVTSTIQMLADYLHSLKPDAPISANDFDVTMRNSYLIYGIDVEALARIQDIIMVENFALPCWDSHPQPRLVNNALTIRNTREFVRDQAHLSVLSYDFGIGFDPVYPPRRHQQAIGEAAACGASMTIKGTEYNNGKRMTLLTDKAYYKQHLAIGNFHHWLEEHQTLYQSRTQIAPVGLLHPGEHLWRHWMALAPVYYSAGQVLTSEGIPWRVVRDGDSMEGLSVLLTFVPDGRHPKAEVDGVEQIHVPALPGWAWRKLNVVAQEGLWHNLAEVLGLSLLRAYHGSRLARWLLDKMKMAKTFTQTTLFNLPERNITRSLLDALPKNITPRVKSDQPVLIEIWQKGNERQIHLLNYALAPQTVEMRFGSSVIAEILSPDTTTILSRKGKFIAFNLDVYSVLVIK